jgi:alanyl-tRNA synthetase
LYQQSIIDNRIKPLLTGSEIPLVMIDLSDYNFDALKVLSHTLLRVDKIVLCAIKERDDKTMNYLISIKGIEDDQALYKKIKEHVLDGVDAKGGGKAPLWQGIATKHKGILTEVEKVCRNVLHE